MQGGFTLFITLPHYLNEEQKSFKELSLEFLGEKLFLAGSEILLLMGEEVLNLRQNVKLFEATKTYLKGYIKALKNEVARIKANLYSEEEIIEYLSFNEDLRQELKQIFRQRTCLS